MRVIFYYPYHIPYYNTKRSTMLKTKGKAAQKQKRIVKKDRKGKGAGEYDEEGEDFNVQDELDQ